jgi:UDP-N-acetylmuramoyl-tripeptide--D-alanyl-D-alanine ligase
VLPPALITRLGHGKRAETNLPPARGVSFHSARVRPGDAFFALPGAAMHGIAFADAALQAGAAFIVTDRPHPKGILVPDPAETLLELGRYAREQLSGPVIGISGSAGKSSTKAMLAAALDAPASPGNFNTPYALASTLVDTWLSGRTRSSDRLVLELGIDTVGEMATLVSLTRPTHAVLTLIAASHLSGLGDLGTVAREKTVLLDAAEHPFASTETIPHLTPTQRARSRTYGLEGDRYPSDVAGRVVSNHGARQELEILGQHLTLPYPGTVMARNAVAALTLASHFGLDLEEAAKRLEKVRLEPGRLEIHTLPSFTLIDDTYNSNPASAEAALSVLRTCPGPHTAILGDMLELGTEAAAFHFELGLKTVGLDAVIAVGPEAREIARANPQAQHFETLNEALEDLSSRALSGTVLVKASRGMKLETLVRALRQRVAA